MLQKLPNGFLSLIDSLDCQMGTLIPCMYPETKENSNENQKKIEVGEKFMKRVGKRQTKLFQGH